MISKFWLQFFKAPILAAMIFSFLAGLYYENIRDFVTRRNFYGLVPVSSPADLLIRSSAVTPVKAGAGDEMTFIAEIENVGSDASSFATRLEIDVGNDGARGGADKTIPILILDAPSLEGGTTKLLNWDSVWVAVSGIHRYEICADVGLVIDEFSEENNCASEIFSVE